MFVAATFVKLIVIYLDDFVKSPWTTTEADRSDLEPNRSSYNTTLESGCICKEVENNLQRSPLHELIKTVRR